MKSVDAHVLEAAKMQVRTSLPMYEDCLKRIAPQQHAKMAQFLTVAKSIAVSAQRRSAKSLQLAGPAL